MARGIGGDDGPSLFMAAACVLGFIWLRDTTTKIKNGVTDTLEIGENSGGPFQDETTDDIAKMEKVVKGFTYRSSALGHPLVYYTNIANKVWTELKANFSTDEALLLKILTPLNADELRCVAKQYGVKERSRAGFTTFTGTIFNWFDEYLDDGITGNDLSNMHKIWKKTGLW